MRRIFHVAPLSYEKGQNIVLELLIKQQDFHAKGVVRDALFLRHPFGCVADGTGTGGC